MSSPGWYYGGPEWESGKTWAIDKKPWDRKHPFHRINSPSYDKAADADPSKPQSWRAILDGLGCKCGCHSKADYSSDALADFFKIITDKLGVPTSANDLIDKLKKVLPGGVADSELDKLKKELDKQGFDKFDITKLLGHAIEGQFMEGLMSMLPAWAPVERGQDEYKEMEGILWNSFLDVNSIPVGQWHSYYDWVFQIFPQRGYAYLQSKGNAKRDASGNPTGTPFDKVVDDPQPKWFIDDPVGIQPGYCAWPMECRWDTGALGGLADTAKSDTYRPPMMSQAGAPFDAATAWLWPDAGQYVWLAGRWVYNCQSATTDDEKGLMRSELHPCRAIATSRWEAFKFKENPGYAPAIRFMFFAGGKGGYIDPPALGKDVKYEFIVDLPVRPKTSARVYPVASTHPVDTADRKRYQELNTLVLGAGLLIDFDYSPFKSVGGKSMPIEPKVELLGPAGKDPTKLQVKVTIPAGTADTYGVIISMGWRDPSGAEAAKVRSVSVRFDDLHKRKVNHDPFFDSEEWLLSASVNGRWLQGRYDGMHNDSSTNPKFTGQVDLHLGPDDELFVTAHGTERNGEGSFLDDPRNDRLLKHLHVDFQKVPGQDKMPWPINVLPGVPTNVKMEDVPWAKIDNRAAGVTTATAAEKIETSTYARDLRLKYLVRFAPRFDNARLGMLLPERLTAPNAEKPVQDLETHTDPAVLASVQNKGPQARSMTAYEWRNLRDSAELQLFVNGAPDDKLDYSLRLELKVDDEPFPAK